MTRLIDADELKKAFYVQECWNAVIGHIIDHAPTVELFCSYLSDGEVKQPCIEGPCDHERLQTNWIDLNGDGSVWMCSNCGEKCCCIGKFCMGCGAKMINADEVLQLYEEE